MAKDRSILRISGKLGPHVHVHSTKYEPHIRRAPAKGLRKDEPQLKQNYERTPVLNTLASEINQAITNCCPLFKDRSFYQRLLSKFFRVKDPGPNRLPLLMAIKGIEVHPAYSLDKLGHQDITVFTQGRHIIFTVTVNTHPLKGRYHADSYTFELLFLYWKKNNKMSVISSVSDWISMTDGNPEFDFSFAKPAGITQWLLCVRKQLWRHRQIIPSKKAEGMQIVEAGTFDKKELKAMKDLKNKLITPVKRSAAEDKRERVKAKRIR